MPNDNLPSVLEYSEDISNQQPPKALPAGTYRGVIKMAEAKKSKAGKLMADVQFHIDPKQYPADYTDGNPDGTILHFYPQLEDNPQSRFRLRKFCEAVGAPMSKRIDLTSWLNLEAKLKTSNEDFQGLPQARIDEVSAI